MSRAGFECLRLSVWGAWRLFGGAAAYVVCVNSVPLAEAQALAGAVPPGVEWRDVTREVSPELASHLDRGMAEGVGWKFAPLRLFPAAHEILLDNDCVLWSMPPVLRRWLEGRTDGACLLAADVRACYGQFAPLCGRAPLNSGLTGLPPGFDLAARIREVLRACPVVLRSELDEQGLRIAALSLDRRPVVVPVFDVSVCSPTPPHLPGLGRHGAHFVGLNAERLGPRQGGAAAVQRIRTHWSIHRPAVHERVGLEPPR